MPSSVAPVAPLEAGGSEGPLESSSVLGGRRPGADGSAAGAAGAAGAALGVTRPQLDRLRVAAGTLRFLRRAAMRLNLSRAILMNVSEYRKVMPGASCRASRATTTIGRRWVGSCGFGATTPPTSWPLSLSHHPVVPCACAPVCVSMCMCMCMCLCMCVYVRVRAFACVCVVRVRRAHFVLCCLFLRRTPNGVHMPLPGHHFSRGLADPAAGSSKGEPRGQECPRAQLCQSGRRPTAVGHDGGVLEPQGGRPTETASVMAEAVG